MMKKQIIALTLLSCLSSLAAAAEYGQVISSTAVTREVLTPQRTCRDEQVEVEQPHNAAGSVIGAVAGGILGSTVGRGAGNAAATAAGVIAGAVVGDQVANADKGTTTRTVRRCSTRQVRSQQIIGYDVVYEYAGRRYTTRLANEPGERIPLQIGPAASVVQDDDQAYDTTETVIEEPAVVTRRAAPVYVTPPVVLHWDLWPGPRGPYGPHHR